LFTDCLLIFFNFFLNIIIENNTSTGCPFKFQFKVGVEELISERTTDQLFNLTSLFALFMFFICRLTNGAFTIDSSTPTLTGILNELPI
jgi:hypothetical protein